MALFPRSRRLLSSYFEPASKTDISDMELDWHDLCDTLLTSRSEAVQLNIAQAILSKYNQADEQDRLVFYEYLLNDLDLDAKSVADAAAAYRAQNTQDNYTMLRRAGRPRRIDLFNRLANVHRGAKCLVKIREDIRKLIKTTPDLMRLDHDLLLLLSSWFNRGFLALDPISWDTPATILEKIIEYEAVHAIKDWDDLRRRLHPADRRCYAFFHPRMPDDPIIFVEVALTDSIPNSVDALLDPDRDERPLSETNTACFYSISNCHAGLAGISFGNALIKQVAHDLAIELPMIETFVTLSPVPTLSKNTPDGTADTTAQFLAKTKRPNGMPVDPVARFHLGNGAALHAVHENANSSAQGLKQSYGTMVNYLYEIDQVDARADRFANDGTVATSKQVAALL